MASIRKEMRLAAAAPEVWSALRDVGAVHTRLARGFVVDTMLQDGTRVVTFANGMIARERIVTIDDAARLLVYTIVGDRMTHHNASFEVIEDGAEHSRIVWTTHLLPDNAAGAMEGMMELGLTAIRRTLEASGGG